MRLEIGPYKDEIRFQANCIEWIYDGWMWFKRAISPKKPSMAYNRLSPEEIERLMDWWASLSKDQYFTSSSLLSYMLNKET